MRFIIYVWTFLLLINCSLNKDSKYWTDDMIKKVSNDKKLKEIINKSSDIRLMTVEEYEIYIDDLIKKSKYPNIN